MSARRGEEPGSPVGMDLLNLRRHVPISIRPCRAKSLVGIEHVLEHMCMLGVACDKCLHNCMQVDN